MRAEEKVMNNGKLQAKQETLKSLHCPSAQSSLFNSRSTSLNTQHNKESATRCPQQLFIDVSTELLRRGQSVRFQAPGLSMHPTIKEGETITVVPVSSFDIKRGDILLYMVGRKVVAHRVVRIKREKNNFATHSKELNLQLIFILRGDASATSDDPVEVQQVLGKVVFVERRGRRIDLDSRRAKMLHFAHARASRLKRLILRILGKPKEVYDG